MQHPGTPLPQHGDIAAGEDEENPSTPWHFKLLLLALVLYLGYRLIQLLEWLIRWAF